jgi:osmotically-inducible protein OsmY
MHQACFSQPIAITQMARIGMCIASQLLAHLRATIVPFSSHRTPLLRQAALTRDCLKRHRVHSLELTPMSTARGSSLGCALRSRAAVLLAIGSLTCCGHGQRHSPLATAALSPLDDVRVVRAVRGQLATERGLDARQVQITVRHGIATLRGQVGSTAEAVRATEAAQLARGVRAVLDHLHVRDAAPTDSTVASNAKQALRQNAELAGSDLQVSVQAGRATLSGTVSDFSHRQLSEALVWSVYGVSDIVNGIRVVPTLQRTDDEIANEVRARLAADGYRESAVRVHVLNRIVTLSGQVGGVSERQRVMDRAAVPGVIDVRDGLTVQQEREEIERPYAGIRSATEMRAAILDAYRLDPRVPDRAVHVTVRSGVAELTGSVSTLAQKLAAGEDAANTVGVWAVKNELTLLGEPAADDRLRDRLRARLAGHPYVNGKDIDVKLERGRVLLTGRVVESFQSRAAERAVRLTPGVVSVDNRLQTDMAPANFRDDDEIRQDIEAELLEEAGVDSSNVKISVENGVATIVGEVENWEVYNLVLENVFEAMPHGVVNHLQRRKPAQLLGAR